MNAIPTTYDGRRFRSRLEARWAAFFTLLEWRFEYEPCDFKGWIPDFVLIGAEQNVFVEVKPVTSFPEDIAEEIDKSGCTDECLILGMAVPLAHEYHDCVLGFLRERANDSDWWWAGAMLGQWSNGGVGFCHEYGGFVDRISGIYDGGSYGGLTNGLEIASAAWKRAGNIVQWNARP